MVVLLLFRQLSSVTESGYYHLDSELRRVTSTVPRLEWCFYIETERPLHAHEMRALRWLLAEPHDSLALREETFLGQSMSVIEIGPRFNFETTWSSNAVAICHDNGILPVTRLERSLRIGLNVPLTQEDRRRLVASFYDHMTHMIYEQVPTSLRSPLAPQPVQVLPLIEEGMPALVRVNSELGLAMDEQDLDRFYRLFVNELKRNPTDVELFQLGQGNCEHSRHGFFKGQLVIDGYETHESLMSIIKEPWRENPNNSLIAFDDDSSAIFGCKLDAFVATRPGSASPMRPMRTRLHPTLTAETHNHPVKVEPYEGAATGIGGRIRDNICVRRGGLVVASGAGYAVSPLAHPKLSFAWPAEPLVASNDVSPIDVLINASNGASDYGNRFGEPIIYGFVRMYGRDDLRGWLKPILYTVGAGQIDHRHTDVRKPEAGMLLVQIGGPAYRIGMGGGAVSSLMAGEASTQLDFDSVQRGNPEMAQRVYRVFRACSELGDENPIVAAHDLGAGGDSNALPEIVYPAGAQINLRDLPVADPSLSTLEIWGNESQERNVVLVELQGLALLEQICEREGAPMAVVGKVTDDQLLTVYDTDDNSTPVQLPLEPILGETAVKRVELTSVNEPDEMLSLEGVTIEDALSRVLQLPSVGSKNYLVRKVDRSVTGLIAQQQCVGPNHLPVSDFAAIAQSHFNANGVALTLGEQPIKGLVSPTAMARMAVAEAVLNMSGAVITELEDIKLEANWMWAAKLPGEGVAMYRAARALSDMCVSLGIAIDGGKDSLSMAARNRNGDIVKVPGQLVVAAYAPMPDVAQKVTPEFKSADHDIVMVDLSGGHERLGGSALAQAYGQIGEDVPDVDRIRLLQSGFEVTQSLIRHGRIASVHDRSDGGLVVTLLEMAFAGNYGFTVWLEPHQSPLPALFNEELGLVIACERRHTETILEAYREEGIPVRRLGSVTSPESKCRIFQGTKTVLEESMPLLRVLWEHTSTELDSLQTNPQCVDDEAAAMSALVQPPKWHLSFIPEPTPQEVLDASDKPKVAILREQGTNGDREMAAAFYMAGFETWDITMTDLLAGRMHLSQFQGIAFPGGFSYGDVLDAGKGWAGKIQFNHTLTTQFTEFYARSDTFSFGVCNGAQLMTLLGWVPVPFPNGGPRFTRNLSGRFESRFSTVRIMPSPAIMLDGMAGSVLGVWVAHAEGHLGRVNGIDADLAPIRYADPDGNITMQYPFNPNGSPQGITALCSPDGRHLAMMPHPERLSHQKWQWPWMPTHWQHLEASPWLRLFQNAYNWCITSRR